METKQTGLQTFFYNKVNKEIRVEQIDGTSWFVAKDVCDALEIAHHRDAFSRLDAYERGSVVVDTPGGKQSVTAINESGLYNLIFQSRKPEAKAFRKWVTSEVLPAIRQTGVYEATVRKERIRRMAVAGDVQMLEMLWLIDESLYGINRGDLALEIGVSRQTIHSVLTGRVRSARVLAVLYRKALENRKRLQFNPYANVNKVICELTK